MLMKRGSHQIGDIEMTLERRHLLNLAAATTLATVLASKRASAEAESAFDPMIPIRRLEDALLDVMKAGGQTPFSQRFAALAPAVDQTFDLNAVLQASVGLRWITLPPDQADSLEATFRRYTIASYVFNFDKYSGQTFRISEDVRPAGRDQVVVQTYFNPKDGAAKELSYLMKRALEGWKAIDVMADGSISRVAVQRSDFRGLISRGGAPALLSRLQQKIVDMSDGALA
jgi:phospholipid transport system substrate-binding protein